MTLHLPSEPDKVIQAGRHLQEARNRKGLSLEMMCKLLGMSQHQIQAIEEGDVSYFNKSTQTLIWHARLYAKKSGLSLQSLNSMSSDVTQQRPHILNKRFPLFF